MTKRRSQTATSSDAFFNNFLFDRFSIAKRHVDVTLLNVLLRFSSVEANVQRVVLAFIEMLVDEFFDSISGRQRCFVVGFEVEFDSHDDPDFGGRSFVNPSLAAVDARA